MGPGFARSTVTVGHGPVKGAPGRPAVIGPEKVITLFPDTARGCLAGQSRAGFVHENHREVLVDLHHRGREPVYRIPMLPGHGDEVGDGLGERGEEVRMPESGRGVGKCS